ncbi:FAD-dependent oxidoreductase [Nocardioides immobilis]|uniref:FAD-dependent oxidoreductase n=1 Tax=Nocardioides immobilis TaxID=2049295 RepID=UPI001FEA7D37|nr:FAD-dependent oxidoreductase [Nocardioides immobilis]
MAGSHSASFDVVVAGGGAAGVAAAIGAARAGARVALLEKTGNLGGAAVSASVLTYCGFFSRRHELVVAGVGARFLDVLAEDHLYLTHTSPETGNKVVLLDLETTKRALDRLVLESGVEALLHVDVVSADTRDGEVQAITYAHAGSTYSIRANSFVDATGDGSLGAASGALMDEAPPHERQASTMVMRIGGVVEDAQLTGDAVEAAVRGYRSSTGGDMPRTRGPLVRLPLSREIMALLVDLDGDMLDPAQHTRAEQLGRLQALHYWRALRDGIPGWQDSFLVETGPTLGIRETRRMVGRERVTKEDVASGRRRPDVVVARGGWPMESHVGVGRTAYGGIRDDAWFDIPIGATQSATYANLWAAGRLICSDSDAYASTRVMGTAFATGHAAGVAAAWQALKGEVDVAGIQATLRDQDALL